jgi:predicted DNA binding CopG/RHH family protein
VANGNQQISVRLPPDKVTWLRVTAAARGITRSQLILELIEAEQGQSASD